MKCINHLFFGDLSPSAPQGLLYTLTSNAMLYLYNLHPASIVVGDEYFPHDAGYAL